jgi:hypothetical protein
MITNTQKPKSENFSVCLKAESEVSKMAATTTCFWATWAEKSGKRIVAPTADSL